MEQQIKGLEKGDIALILKADGERCLQQTQGFTMDDIRVIAAKESITDEEASMLINMERALVLFQLALDPGWLADIREGIKNKG